MSAIGKNVNILNDYYAVSLLHFLIHSLRKIGKSVYRIIYDTPSMLKYDKADDKTRQTILSAGIFIRKDQLKKTAGNQYEFSTRQVGEDKNLHAGDCMFAERYIRKAAGSCYAKDRNTISTAYHIIDAAGGDTKMFIENYFAVFGFTGCTTETVLLPEECVTELEKVTAFDTNEKVDFIDFKVKGGVPGFVNIPKLHSGILKCGMEIYVAGHPLKSSLTVSANAVIESISEHSITAHADLFEYSSGSPVFLKATHELIGFVKGSNEKDFIPYMNTGYMQTNIVRSAESSGKRIILIKQTL